MRIGLFGGTFNPVHIGHLVLAEECWSILKLDKVIFIPAFIPPLKNFKQEVSVADRLNMLRLALEGDKRFEISTFEIDKGGVSYTIDTVKHFRAVYDRSAKLFFLTGADSAKTLSKWKEPEEIINTVKFVIASRPVGRVKCPFEKKIKRVDIPLLDISSIMIRNRVKNRQPIDFFVPEKVVKYIRNKGLYRD